MAGQEGKFRELLAGLRQGAEKAGVKVLGTYLAPQEHKLFVTIEIPDDKAFIALQMEPGFTALLHWGTAQLIPVIWVEQVLASQQAGT